MCARSWPKAWRASGVDSRLHDLSGKAESAEDFETLEQMQSSIDTLGGWQPELQVEAIISQLALPGALLSELSGGWRRRVALAKALVSKPIFCCWTNRPTAGYRHYSMARARSSRLQRQRYFHHSRSRVFAETATRIVEIDRGRIISWPGDYANYLQLKEQALEEEETRNALFDKRLAQEEAWIRQGIKARRTRNEGRVRALKAMRDERAKRLTKQGKARYKLRLARNLAEKS